MATKPKELIAKWPLNKNFNFEGWKSAIFLPIAFRPSLPRKFPRNSSEIGRFFHDFVPKNPVKFDIFFSRPIRSPVFYIQIDC